MTLGEWVSHALNDTAERELGEAPPAAPETGVAPPTAPESRLAPSAEGEAPPAPRPSALATASEEAALARAVLAIAERIEGLETRDAEMLELARRIDEAGRPDDTGDARADRRAAIERQGRALAALAKRIDGAERRERTIVMLMRGLAVKVIRAERRLGALANSLAKFTSRIPRNLAAGQRHAPRHDRHTP